MRVTLDALAHAWLLRLVGLGRYPKRVILASVDFATLGLALWLTMSLRLGEPYVPPSWGLALILLAAPTIGVATFFQLGLYRLVTRYIGGQGAVLIPVAVFLSALLWAFLVLLSGIQVSGVHVAGVHIPGVSVVPRSVIVLYPVFGAAFVWANRQVAGWMLKHAGIEIPVRFRENAQCPDLRRRYHWSAAA
jgi:FlaA1/EpsC-like NDP-sugar epimerase